MARPKMSKRVQQIYDYVADHISSRGYPPSVREIGDAVGLKSPSTVHMHLKTLEELGLIRRDPNKPRTIELVDQTPRQHPHLAPVDGTVAKVTVDERVSEGLVRLPLVGRVAAGQPILAEQNVEEMVCLPTAIVGTDASFMLKVRGDSMVEAGIFDGDYIVCHQQQDAQNGEIVVALLDDSATVKTFFREKDMIRLQPQNEAMDPIYVRNPQILGRVVALLRHVR